MHCCININKYGEILEEHANLFQETEAVKIKPESEISRHITLRECNKWFVPH